MKKRSNPIPLLSVMILCLVLVGYFNSRNSSANQDPQQQQQQQQQQSNTEDTKVVGPPSQGPSKQELLSQVTPGGGKGPTTAPAMGAGQGPLMNVKPHLVLKGGPQTPPKMAQAKPFKPKPTDSSISTQWYTNETNKNLGN